MRTFYLALGLIAGVFASPSLLAQPNVIMPVLQAPDCTVIAEYCEVLPTDAERQLCRTFAQPAVQACQTAQPLVSTITDGITEYIAQQGWVSGGTGQSEACNGTFCGTLTVQSFYSPNVVGQGVDISATVCTATAATAVNVTMECSGGPVFTFPGGGAIGFSATGQGLGSANMTATDLSGRRIETFANARQLSVFAPSIVMQ